MCQIMFKTRAEPLTEGVKAFPCESRSDATGLHGSWNRLTPSASLGSAPPPEGEESEEGEESCVTHFLSLKDSHLGTLRHLQHK